MKKLIIGVIIIISLVAISCTEENIETSIDKTKHDTVKNSISNVR